jgi:phage terminase large subunit GpA-like protein
LVAKLSRVSARQRRGSPGKYLLQSWATTRGKRLAPYWTFVDSGYLPTEVYKFCRSGTHRFPTKGIGTASMPWVEPTPEKRHGLLHIRTDAGKYLFYSRLAINERTADGYVHLPMS